MRTNYITDLDPTAVILNADDCVVMTRQVFEQLADYTQSQPTGPSVDRIWRRSEQWSNPDHPNWFVWVAREDEAGRYAIGRPVFLVDDDIDSVPNGRARARRAQYATLTS